jgi:guanylate kinase
MNKHFKWKIKNNPKTHCPHCGESLTFFRVRTGDNYLVTYQCYNDCVLDENEYSNIIMTDNDFELTEIPRYNIVALVGKAGSGKDTLLRHFFNNIDMFKKIASESNDKPHFEHSMVNIPNMEFNEIISYTSRPKRENEVSGINYHFCSYEDFCQKISNGEMLEYSKFNNWLYGTCRDSLRIDAINVGVFNLEGAKTLMRLGHNVLICHIYADDKSRLLRQLNRESRPNVTEIIRRYATDITDFEHLDEIPFVEIDNSDPPLFERESKEIQQRYIEFESDLHCKEILSYISEHFGQN